MYKIILASGSPRRHELLRGLEIDFEVRLLPDIEEGWPSTLTGEQIPMEISRRKSEAYRPTLAPDELIITADTIVCLDGQVLGKPADEDEARRMLASLSGRTHEVITGVTFLTRERQHTFASTTRVTFDTLSPEDIDHYVSHYHPLDKAGAYGVQEWIGYIGVSSIEGSFYNVMGLPVQRLRTELKEFTAQAQQKRPQKS